MAGKMCRRIAPIVACMVLSCLMLSGCGKSFVCDFCGEKCKGEMYDLTSWGRGHVCQECYNVLWGRG